MNASQNKTGTLLFSLDTELAWGYFDQFRPGDFSPDGVKERESVRILLDILHEYHITATWGVVGHMLYKKCENCKICPILDWKDKYASFEHIYEAGSRLWYGPDVLESILDRGDGHEIAFHGYTHSIFDERTMSEEAARIEIEEWLRLAQRTSITPYTVIFPRNRVGFLNLFKEYGFACYRGDEILPEICSYPLVGRFFRRYHDFLSSFTTPSVFERCELESSGLINVPSTQHLLEYSQSAQKMLNALDLHKLCIDRVKMGVQKAVEERKIFHLRAHPNDFRSEKDFDILRRVFSYAADEVARGRLQSVSMGMCARTSLFESTERAGESSPTPQLRLSTG